jgi:hypothetical protein
MLRRTIRLALAVALLGSAARAGGPTDASSGALDVVATGVPRPLQLALDGKTLVILSPGATGGVAGELYRVDLGGAFPVDLSRQPRVRIPFVGQRPTTLGSLAIDPRTRDLYLGEENGGTIYRLNGDEQLTVYATGLRRLAGGGTIAFDPANRLVVVDYADPMLSSRDERLPPDLEAFRDEEDYRGPLVFRLVSDATTPLPRRMEVRAPLFPRAWGGRAGGGELPRLISVAPVDGDELVFLASSGDVYRLTGDGRFGAVARLPRGQYNRTNMVAARDGGVFISGGFHVGQIVHVARDGAVTVLAGGLADPEGIAVDEGGDLYVAESALHRIVRLRAPGR